MLTRLSIRDIVLIDRLDIDFADGLAVLTGETGAGKSILLDAFALALGARGDAALVRHGAEQGQVTAAFELPRNHPVRALAADNGIQADDELILRRAQFADGRTRAFVNDQPVSVQALRSLGAALVEIHGQHDDRALVDAATHRRLLDAFGDLDGEADEVARLWNERRTCEEELATHRADVERAQREADWLRHAVEELRRLSPEPSEETALAERRTAMMQVEKVAGDLREAHDAVAGAQSPVPTLACRGAPARAPHHACAGIDRARGEGFRRRAQCARRGALASRSGARAPPITIRASSSASRSGCSRCARPDASTMCRSTSSMRWPPRYSGRSRADRRRRGEACRARKGGRARRWSAIARPPPALSGKRRKAAEKLDKAVNAELKPLRLERATFTTDVATDEASPGPHGFDRVEFWVQTNPGTRPGPMMKVASGGELARFLLALKVVLADRGSAPSLVFDEIDTGVGGAVADAIGARLSRLAQRAQVIAVTHAPQVAARAGRHYLISKDTLDRGKRVATRVAELAAERRREEIARMLAGAEITAEARAAAERLIKAAG